MKTYKLMIPVVLGLFVWQGVADAASISTRVRVLENKVAKQDRQIKQTLRQAQGLSKEHVDKTLAQVKALEKKVDVLLKNSEDAKRKASSSDKRYAFP